MARTGERFRQLLDMAATSTEDACTLWPYGLNNGYASVRAQGKTQYGHKLVRILYHGDGPGLVTLHSCNNTACVNPHHLRAGTQAENIQQAMASGRMEHLADVRNRGKPEAKALAVSLLLQGKSVALAAAKAGLSVCIVHRYKARMLKSGELSMQS